LFAVSEVVVGVFDVAIEGWTEAMTEEFGEENS
jgi:hypothetical protein